MRKKKEESEITKNGPLRKWLNIGEFKCSPTARSRGRKRKEEV